MYYLAYGSNMNREWMAQLCPTAQIIGKGNLPNYRLAFRGQDNGVYATIEKYAGEYVPFILWQINKVDEIALDAYEDYPKLYKKGHLTVSVDNQLYDAMVYMMNERPFGVPNDVYYNMIQTAYRMYDLDTLLLEKALHHSSQHIEKGE
ncbi:gamma-glutamylcyclotransferase [Carnobacteriaceae bacterium zg-ZUI252]|nr:gamma-glutamylcyclotransferase [Carnobacteriaceae bacterium zg-ZUI252]MBS4770162.1 gamma-glutamylcyclotransferase [Carnobacteriaceae bacterium zg-ZUI240]